jgi:hypothetical protein
MEDRNQMTKRKLLSFTLVMVSFVFLCSTTVFAQQTRIADMNNNGSSVSFTIRVPYKSATLTVSTPDGQIFRKEFPAGLIPVFSPVNNRGEFFESGSFTYELVLTPFLSGDIEDKLDQAREKGTSDRVATNLRRRGLLPAPMIQSGSFSVLNGNMITGDQILTEPTSVQPVDKGNTVTSKATDGGGVTPEDQVIPDDLIVNGSACIGLDCVNGENFGFDTLRLKENNLRLHFEDTSVGSFPSNDWRITINSSNNGGASFFAIDDASAGTTPFSIAAGAGNNALIVDSQGRVGMGTSTPVVELQIADGDSPTIRLEQNGSSGFTAQTFDIASNESNFFIRDVTNGSALPFRIIPGSSGSSLIIGQNGRVGVGFNTNSGVSLGNQFEVRNNGSTPLFRVDTNGKVTSASSVEVESGGIIFPDGTVQTTAGGGGGGGSAPLGKLYGTSIFGGSGTVLSNSTLVPTIDTNSFGMGVTGAGFASVAFNLPTNPNLADPGGNNMAFEIRYRDSDGTGTASKVVVTAIQINPSNGARTVLSIFDSNTDAGTGFKTVTVCKPANFLNFNSYAYHMFSNLRSSAGTNADLVYVKMYKTLSCP